MNVIQKVVANSWCVGCGICAAVCPKKRLEIHWNERGEYNPVEVAGCLDCSEACSLCYQVCPAHRKLMNETEIGRQWYGAVEDIQHTDETGYFRSSYVGYSKDHRPIAASGGMATWVLENLLISNAVDAVLAVGRTNNPDKLFEFKVCRTVEELRSCARSSYYPVETSQVIQHILSNDGRYAIIGLPCVCKAIRLAQGKLPKLKKRIKFVLGLTCGHQSSKFFAEYICALGGGNPHELKEIIFRTKDFSQPASNLAINFRSGDGCDEVKKQVLWGDGVNTAYLNGYFQLPGCFNCDDVFAECADACFMDAWLPEYAKDPKGTSLLLVRRLEIDALLVGLPEIQPIDINQIRKSQINVIKRKRLMPFTHNSPLKRNPQKIVFYIDRMVVDQMAKLSTLSGECWKRDIDSFHKEIEKYKKRILNIYSVRKIILLPVKFLKYLLKK